MKRLMIASDWTHGLLQGTVGGGKYNLDDPANVALLDRLVSRYDVFVFGWFSEPVRDRIRQLAASKGRKVLIFKYVDPMAWRPNETEGSMSLVPSSTQVISTDGQRCSRPEWCLRKADGTPIRSSIAEGSGFLVDPSGPGLLEASKTHVLHLADGFDGVFLDLMNSTYLNEVANQSDSGDYRWPLTGWNSVPGYAEAKLALHSALADHLGANGKKCMHNTSIGAHGGTFWPQLVAQSSTNSITFIENFATNWQGVPVTFDSPGYGQWLRPTLQYMQWCNNQRRPAAFQFLSNDAAQLPYGYSLFLQYAGEDSIFSGCALNSQQLYSSEPTEIAAYGIDLGAPAGDSRGSTILTRQFQHGIAVTNTTQYPTSLNLNGCYRTVNTATEWARTTVPPMAGEVFKGAPFSVTRIAPSNPGAVKLTTSGWANYQA